MSATKYIIWDRQDARPIGDPPQLFDSSAAATAHTVRVPRHDGGKKASVTFDVVQVTVN